MDAAENAPMPSGQRAIEILAPCGPKAILSKIVVLTDRIIFSPELFNKKLVWLMTCKLSSSAQTIKNEFGCIVVPFGNFHFCGNKVLSDKYTFDKSNNVLVVLYNSIQSSLSEYSSFSKSVL